MTELPTDEMVQASSDYSDQLFDSVLMIALGKEHTEPTLYDSAGILFGVWVSLTQCLATCGWNADELCADVIHHVGVVRAN